MVVFALSSSSVQAAVITWDGGGADGTCGGGVGDGNKWSCDANWSSNVEPGVGDIATFDGTSTKAATLDGAISVGGVDINTGYSGVVTQAAAATLTVGTSDFDISAGTFTGSDGALDFNDAFTVSGGTFTSTSGNMAVAGAFTVSSGSFAPSTGTVTADGSTATWNVSVTETFNNLIINRTSTMTITSGDTLVVDGTLTLTNGVVNTGTITANGDISQTSGFDGGSAIIDFGNDGVGQTYTAAGGIAPNIRLDSAADASDTVLHSAATTFTSLTVTSGFSGTIPFSNAGDFVPTFTLWSQAAGTYDASAQTAWNIVSLTISGGTLTAPALVTASGTTGTYDVNTSQTFADFTINRTSSLVFGTNDTLAVDGTLTLTNGSISGSTGEIIVQGDVNQGAGFDGGNGYIDFGNDSLVQTYTVSGGTAPRIRLDSAADASDDINIEAAAILNAIQTNAGFSGAIPLNNPSDFTLVIDAWTQAVGTYDASAQSAWNLSGDLTLSVDTFVPPVLVTATGTSGSWNVVTSLTFNQLTINRASSVSMIAGDTFVVTGLLTLTNGSITGSTSQVDARANISQGAGFDGGTAYIDFGDDSVAQTYTITGGIAPRIRLNSAADANDDIDIGAAATLNAIEATSDFSGAIPLNNPSDFTLTVDDWMQAAGSYDASAQSAWNVSGDFDITGGTFIAPTLITATVTSGTWNFNGTQTFNQLTINRISGTSIGEGDILTLTGNLILTNGTLSTITGSIEPQANVTVQAGFDGSTVPLRFSGSATQSFDLTGATDKFTADIYVNKDGGQVNLLSALVVDEDNQDLIIEEGKFYLSGQALTVNGLSGTFIVEDGGNFQLQGAETITLNATYPTLNSGSIVTYVGDGDTAIDTYTLTTLKDTYSNLVINSTDGATDTFQPATALDVNADLTLTSGTLNMVSGQDYALTIGGDWTNAGTFAAQAGTVTFDADADHSLTGDTTWYDFIYEQTSNDAASNTLTLASGSIQTIGSSLLLNGLDSSDKIIIIATMDGSEAAFDFTGASTFTGDYLTVSDNTAIDNSSAVTVPLNPANSEEGSNTDGWFSDIGVTVSAISGNTTEAGGTATYTVVLDFAPLDDVVIDSATNDATEGTVTNGSSLTFTTDNWDTPQTVTVTGVNDDVDDGDVVYTIDVSTNDTGTLDAGYDAYDPSDVSVTNTDDDTAGVTVSVISGNTTEAGGTATFTVVLTSEPLGDVRVDSASSDSTEGTVTSGATRTFTTLNWSTPQTVTVTGVNDDVDDGDIAYSIQTSTDDASTADAAYDAINPNDVSVTNTDNDALGASLVESGGNTAVAEASETSDTFTLVLTSEPSNNVTVDLAFDADITGSTAQLTFTTENWDTPQEVTVTAVDDDLDETDPHVGVVTFEFSSSDLTYDGLVFDALDVDVTDNDTSSITVSAISGNTTEAGGTATFTVVLETEPSDTVTIAVATNDDSEGAVTSGGTLTFTVGDYSTPQTVTVTGADDDLDDGDVAYMIILGAAVSNDLIYNGLNPADVDVTNTDNDTAGITVVESGGATSVDELGATSDDYTLVLTSEPTSDVAISLTYDATEIEVSAEVFTFTNANWDTPQAVTVTALDDSQDETSPMTVTISHTAASFDGVYDGFVIADVEVEVLDNDSSGSGGVSPSFVTGVIVEARQLTNSCTDGANVDLFIQARGAVRVFIANDAEFIESEMYDFEPDASLADEAGIEAMLIPWHIPATEGLQTVYVLLVSTTNNRHPTVPVIVDLGVCAPSADDDTTDDEDTGETTPPGPVANGDVFKGEGLPTVYWLEDGLRRPFWNEEIFYTWFTNMDSLVVVPDETLSLYPMGEPILPQTGVILVQIESQPEVYTSEAPNILHHISNEEDARFILGDNWQDFILTVPPTMFRHYWFGEAFVVTVPLKIRDFFTRFGLTRNDQDRDGLTDDEELLYETNPDLNDTDNDGFIDSQEVENGTDPLVSN
ncbi:MAG: hypothetical protein WAZ14_04220 [Patescibacteria group bacterium]